MVDTIGIRHHTHTSDETGSDSIVFMTILHTENRKIYFRVCGKPPKKSGQSIWTDETKSDQVVELRKCAARAKKEINMEYPMRGPLKICLTIYSPQDIIKKERTHEYVGDLDTLVAGTFDALRKADPNVTPHEKFKQNKEISADKELIIVDDSNITAIEACKIKSNEEYYDVTITDNIRGSVCSRLLKRLGK